MSNRAEQFALTLYTPWSEDGMSRKDNTEVIEACIKGYEQAEKDLALTLKQVVKLDNIIMNMVGEGYNDGYKTRPFYEEVLKRFKEQKDETNS